jgi:hypothetical protein
MLAAHGPHHRDSRSRGLGLLRATAPHTRNYTAFGPFQFDRRQYDDALHALTEVIRSPGVTGFVTQIWGFCALLMDLIES